MEISGSMIAEVSTAVVTFIGGLGAVAKYVASRINRLEKDRKDSEKALQEQHREVQDRCHNENKGLVLRIQELERRSHDEGREDRISMMSILDKNATAMTAIAERLPEITPRSGHRIQGTDHG